MFFLCLFNMLLILKASHVQNMEATVIEIDKKQAEFCIKIYHIQKYEKNMEWH